MNTPYPAIRRGAEIAILLDAPIDPDATVVVREDISAWTVTGEVRLGREDGQLVGACTVTRPDAYGALLSFVTTTVHPVGDYYITARVAPPTEPIMVPDVFIVRVRP